MKKEQKSEWWALANVNFCAMGVVFLVSLIILLIGNFVNVDINPAIAGTICFVIIFLSNFLGNKLCFREGWLEKKSYILYNVYSFILYVVLAFTVVPLAIAFISIEVNEILVTLIFAIILFLSNFIFSFNLNAKEDNN